MSFTIVEKRYADGVKLVAQVKLPNGKWRQYPTYQTDRAKAEKAAKRIEKAIAQGIDPNTLGARTGTLAKAPQDDHCMVAAVIETYLNEKHQSWEHATFLANRFPLYLFRDFIGDVDVRQLREEDLINFREFLRQRGRRNFPNAAKKGNWKPIKPHTLRDYETVLLTFLNWAGKRHKFTAPKIDRTPLPKHHGIHYWSQEECTDLISAAQGINVHGQSFALYWLYLLSTGMRKTEAALTEWEWIDMHNRQIRLPGRHPVTNRRITKDGEWRIIPIPPQLYEQLERWPTGKIGRLFLMSEMSGHISDNFDRTIERANKKRQEEGRPLIPRLTPHATRHTYAVQSLQEGMDLFALAQILGHSSTDTTMRHYAMLAGQELKRQLAKAEAFHTALSEGMRPVGKAA